MYFVVPLVLAYFTIHDLNLLAHRKSSKLLPIFFALGLFPGPGIVRIGMNIILKNYEMRTVLQSLGGLCPRECCCSAS